MRDLFCRFRFSLRLLVRIHSSLHLATLELTCTLINSSSVPGVSTSQRLKDLQCSFRAHPSSRRTSGVDSNARCIPYILQLDPSRRRWSVLRGFFSPAPLSLGSNKFQTSFKAVSEQSPCCIPQYPCYADAADPEAYCAYPSKFINSDPCWTTFELTNSSQFDPSAYPFQPLQTTGFGAFCFFSYNYVRAITDNNSELLQITLHSIRRWDNYFLTEYYS